MALIDDVKATCDRLAPHGWRDLLLHVTNDGLDISQPDAASLKAALANPLSHIDRTHPGFEDFAANGTQAITPGSPARSLLYHALASPHVRTDLSGSTLKSFPSLREIDDVENCVFGAEPPTLDELAAQADTDKFDIVVFAYEYRPGRDTCARQQSDLVFSRTGISRVGTAPALYDRERRGFWPEVSGDVFAIRVCPARYAAFLAVRKKGDRARSLPMRHQGPDPQRNPQGDAGLDFWVPVHKLFDGPECITGLDLQVALSAAHMNEKIRRIHIALGESNPPTMAPFRFSAGIADLSTDPDLPGLLVPIPHARLVEPATQNGSFVTFRVPKNNGSAFAAWEPGTDEDAFGEVRPVPAYVHARTEIENGVPVDLNNDPARPDVRATVGRGDYDALHYVDFTGEGQVSVTCTGFAGTPRVREASHPAYSLVAAPDFFPSSGQRELTEWTRSKRVPQSLRARIWAVPPTPLCDVRLPANLQLPGNAFDAKEVTVTALVGALGSGADKGEAPVMDDVQRHSCLPDDAAGVFAPGWAVSHDQLRKGNRTIPHLAAYGLGSPFPEDAKLCAALSAFWPTVAPDISRELEPNPNPRLRATIAPLTDEEIGQVGDLPWDGIAGPRTVVQNGQLFAECESFLHADFVEAALENRFSLRLTARVRVDEYQRRVLAMALVYRVLGGDRNRWFVLSFLEVGPGNPELQVAQSNASTILPGHIYRFDLFLLNPANPSVPSPTNFRRRLVPVNGRRFFFVDPDNLLVLQRRDQQTLWTPAVLNV